DQRSAVGQSCLTEQVARHVRKTPDRVDPAGRDGMTRRAISGHAGYRISHIKMGYAAEGFGQTPGRRRSRRDLRLRTRKSRIRRLDCQGRRQGPANITTRAIQLKNQRYQTRFDRLPEANAETDTRTSRQ